MKIAIASPPIPQNLTDGLYWLDKLTAEAAKAQAVVLAFPESYLPGYPGMGYPEADRSATALQQALQQACAIAAQYSLALVLPMDWYEGEALYNVAFVIDASGQVLGYQTKNQLDPSEDAIWTPGTQRHLFKIGELTFGITICHEGFRYPESVRWAAQHGAQVVFHPHFSGNNVSGPSLSHWGAADNPYYEKAMQMRALENTIYFASANYASRYPESAGAIIAPDGTCIAHATYGQVGITVADIDLNQATGLLAKRFKNHLY